MGGKSSKSSNNSHTRLSRYDRMQELALRAANLRRDVTNFDGSRAHSQYKYLQQALIDADREAHHLREGTIRRQTRNECDALQQEIRACRNTLERKTGSADIDVGTEESNSFITQNFVRKKSGQRQSTRSRREQTLERLDAECERIEGSVRNAIAVKDTQEVDVLEKKIERIYTNLEMLKLEPKHAVRKDSLGKRLIKCNARIRKYKKLLRESVAPDDIAPIEEALQKLESRVVNFAETKDDQSYKQLQQILESHWTRLYSIDAIGEEEKARKSHAIEKAKCELQRLEARAHKNQQQRKAMDKLQVLQHTLDQLTNQLDQHKATIEQLQLIETKLGEIEEPTSQVRATKTNILTAIYQLYSNFGAINQRTSVEFHEVIDPGDLTHQISDLYQRWSMINDNLDALNPKIVEMLREITDGISQKLQQKHEEPKPDLLKNSLQQLKMEAQTVLKLLDSNLDQKQLLDLEAKLNHYYDLFKKSETTHQDQDNISNMLTLLDEGLSIVKDKKNREKLVEIKAALEYCRQLLIDGYEENFPKIRETLSDNRKELELLGDVAEKNQLIAAIDELDRELAAKQRLKDKDELKGIVQDTKNLQEMVDNFSGSLDDIDYKQISAKLTQHLEKLNRLEFTKDDKLAEAHLQTVQNIRRIAKTLRDKSTKSSSSDKDQSHVQINALRDKLVEAKRKTEFFSGTYRDPAYCEIESNIRQCRRELFTIKDNGHRSIVLSKEQYANYIEQLFEYFEEKARSGIVQDSDDPVEILDVTGDLLVKIEEEITWDVTRYQEQIVRELRRCNGNLEAVKTVNVALIQRRRNELLIRCDALEKQFHQELRKNDSTDSGGQLLVLEAIEQLDRGLEGIRERIRRFRGDKTSKEFGDLDETLIQSLIKLDEYGRASEDERVQCAKQHCEQRVRNYIRLLESNVRN